MKIRTRDFRVAQGATVRLRKWPTRVPPVYETNDAYEKMLTRHVSRLADLQELLYASDQYTLLVIFQGMDTSGKDGAIKHVMSGVNPQGCHVTSFKHPSATELQHDFLWRAVQALPERGCIGIFNRSYYEEVLIARVHPEILRAQNLPDGAHADADVWRQRYQSITNMERHLHRNGTRILKFFLHLSKEEQRKRFLERIDKPEKNWKFSGADIKERGYWKQYAKAYEACLQATSTRRSPLYVVPADDKRNARLIVSRVIVESLKRLDVHYPPPDPARERELRALRRLLAR